MIKKNLLRIALFGFFFNGLVSSSTSIDAVDDIENNVSGFKKAVLSLFYAGSAIYIKEKSGIGVEANNRLVGKFLSASILSPGILKIMSNLADPFVGNAPDKAELISKFNKIFKVSGKTYGVGQGTLSLLNSPYVKELDKSKAKALSLLISLGIAQYFLSRKVSEKLEVGANKLFEKVTDSRDASSLLAKFSAFGVNELALSKAYDMLHAFIVSKILYNQSTQESSDFDIKVEDKEIIKYTTSLADLTGVIFSK